MDGWSLSGSREKAADERCEGQARLRSYSKQPWCGSPASKLHAFKTLRASLTPEHPPPSGVGDAARRLRTGGAGERQGSLCSRNAGVRCCCAVAGRCRRIGGWSRAGIPAGCSGAILGKIPVKNCQRHGCGAFVRAKTPPLGLWLLEQFSAYPPWRQPRGKS